jgi:GxxExxY protein
MLYRDLSKAIIGVYYDVYNGTGRTYPEFIYEQAMQKDLQRCGIPCRRQPEYQVYYKDQLVGVQQLDLFAAREIVVELKVAPALTKLHKAQAVSYLKVVGKNVGLLCIFGSPRPEFHRLYFDRHFAPTMPTAVARPHEEHSPAFLTAELSYQVIGGLYTVHSLLGPGFIHRIYANAVHHELSLRGLEPLPRRDYHVYYRGESIGEIKFNHVQVDDRLMVFPVAVQHLDAISITNLKAWIEAQHVPLGILANFYPEQLEYRVLRTGG